MIANNFNDKDTRTVSNEIYQEKKKAGVSLYLSYALSWNMFFFPSPFLNGPAAGDITFKGNIFFCVIKF